MVCQKNNGGRGFLSLRSPVLRHSSQINGSPAIDFSLPVILPTKTLKARPFSPVVCDDDCISGHARRITVPIALQIFLKS